MKELLESNGWVLFHQCNCGGSLRQHYHNTLFPHYEIRIRPTKLTFYILYKGSYAANPAYAYRLESKMKELNLLS